MQPAMFRVLLMQAALPVILMPALLSVSVMHSVMCKLPGIMQEVLPVTPITAAYGDRMQGARYQAIVMLADLQDE